MFCNAKNKKKVLYFSVFLLSLSQNTSRSILPHFFGMCWTKCFPFISSSFMFLRTFAQLVRTKVPEFGCSKSTKRFSWPTSMARCTVDANNLFKHGGLKKNVAQNSTKINVSSQTHQHTHTQLNVLSPAPRVASSVILKKRKKHAQMQVG